MWNCLQCQPKTVSKSWLFSELLPGSGSRDLFWMDNWLDGRSIKTVATKTTVAEALQSTQWIADLKKQKHMSSSIQLLNLIHPNGHVSASRSITSADLT
jgi:hypothetical protein